MLAGTPAGAFALFFGDFFEEGEGLRAAVLGTRGKNCVEQCNRSDVGGAERGGRDRGDEKFVAFTGEGRKVGVRDADAVSAVGAGLLNAVDGLAETAAESDGYDQILFGNRASEVRDAAGGGSRENRQAEQAELIFQIFGEDGSKVAGQKDDAARFVEALGQRGEALCVQTIFQSLEIFQVLSKRIPHVLGHVGIAAAYLHRVERGGKSEREFMQMMLKLTVVGKAKPSNDAHYRGGIGAQAFGHGAHAEENVFARVLE